MKTTIVEIPEGHRILNVISKGNEVVIVFEEVPKRIVVKGFNV